MTDVVQQIKFRYIDIGTEYYFLLTRAWWLNFFLGNKGKK